MMINGDAPSSPPGHSDDGVPLALSGDGCPICGRDHRQTTEEHASDPQLVAQNKQIRELKACIGQLEDTIRRLHKTNA